MVISIKAEKACDKIPYVFTIVTYSTLGIKKLFVWEWSSQKSPSSANTNKKESSNLEMKYWKLYY